MVEHAKRFKAIVIYPDEKIRSTNAIAIEEARKSMHLPRSSKLEVIDTIFSSIADVLVVLVALPEEDGKSEKS